MPAATSIALGGMAVAGGVAGAMGNHSSSSTTVNQGPASELESRAYQSLLGKDPSMSPFGGMQGFESMLSQYGPNGQDVGNATASQRSLASMYGDYAKTGGLPGQGEIDTANKFAQDIFSAQRTQLNQNFQDQQMQFNRQLSSTGRGTSDPVFAAKMYDQMQRQQALLGSQQGSYAAQMALALPQQKLQYATQGAEIQNALGQQAMQNRSTILGLGSQLMNSERQYRLQSAGQTQQQSSGGGLGGFLTGALGGASAGAGVMSGLGALGASGGGFGSLGGGVPSGGFANSMTMPAFGGQFNGAPRTFNLGGP